MYASTFRSRARASLSGNWLISALTVFIASVLGGAMCSRGGGSVNFNADYSETIQKLDWNIPANVQQILIAVLMSLLIVVIIGAGISFLIGGTVRLGHAQYLLDQHDMKNPGVGVLFSHFHQYGNGFCLALLTGIYTFLWTLLFIIPGIIATYRYAMAPFIQAEHPEYSASESIAASKKMMSGHKWELFCLDLSFIGWALLCIFTLGIGNIFLNAYKSAAYAAFYRELCQPQAAPDSPYQNEWPDLPAV